MTKPKKTAIVTVVFILIISVIWLMQSPKTTLSELIQREIDNLNEINEINIQVTDLETFERSIAEITQENLLETVYTKLKQIELKQIRDGLDADGVEYGVLLHTPTKAFTFYLYHSDGESAHVDVKNYEVVNGDFKAALDDLDLEWKLDGESK